MIFTLFEIYFTFGVLISACCLYVASDQWEDQTFWFSVAVLMLIIFLYPFFIAEVIYNRIFKK